MKIAYKRLTAIFCSLILFIGFASCKREETPQNETEITSDLSTSTQTTSEIVPVINPQTDETTTQDNYRFSGEGAVLLGQVNSEIYGYFKVYFEENHIALIDEFGDAKFTFSAQGYSTTDVIAQQDEAVVLGDDMNFDGYSDLRILYRKVGLNSYYLCWMWNMTSRSYVFYEPLSSIPCPEFNKSNQTVISYNKTSTMQTSVVDYQWSSGELNPVSHKVVTGETQPVNDSQYVQTTVSVVDGVQLATVTLFGNKNSSSRWICKIENENVVKLYGDNFNEQTTEHQFVFRGQTAGTTTVVLRYATSWESEYIAEKILNVTVAENKVVTIRVIE